VNKAILSQGGSSTPLEYACITSTVWSAAEGEFVAKPISVEIVKLLVEAGASVHATNAYGFTALHNLLRAPAAPVAALQLVIQRGANVNALDVTRRTPLMMCLNEHTDTALPLQQIAALISAGADCSRANRLGVTPLHWTALWPEGKTALLKLLLRGGADVAQTLPDDCQTALYSAVIGGCAETVQLLLEAGSSVHHRDSRNMTPLFMVRTLPVLNLLLAAGADVKAVGFAGFNVLHMMCCHDDPQPTAAVV
jgi:uncharacterized protein